jgi:tetratricopeptide (TPR) repeat protein
MLERLEQRLALLTGGARDLPSRQQTLRGAIDWSYGLLGEAERRLLARLAVFAGGCRLEAAEAVCQARLDELEALLENNLLRREEPPDGEPRFLMLETIREYAAELLGESGELEPMRRAHLDHFLAWAEARDASRRKGEIYGGWRVEEEDYENVRAAIAWTRESGQTDLELRLAAAMGLYWSAAGYLSEGRAWLEDALLRASSASPQARALALRSCANLAWRQDEPERSTELAETALAISSELGDRLGVAECAQLLGVAAEWRGDYEEQARRYEQAEQTFRELGYERGLAIILNNRGYVAVVLGDYERAEQLLRESLEVQSNPE